MSLQVFGVRVEKSDEVTRYFRFVSGRAEGPGVHQAFARWVVKKLRFDMGEEYAVMVSSEMPSARNLAFFVLVITLLLTGFVWSWWLSPGIALLAGAFFTSNFFRYVVLRVALRRWGYKGPVDYLRGEYVLRKLLPLEAEA